MAAVAIGVDPSMTATGVAWLDHTGAVSVRTIRTLSSAAPARYREILNVLVPLVGQSPLHQRPVTFLEDVHVQHVDAAKALAGLHAVLEYALWLRRVPYTFVHAVRVKVYATGRGNADKAAMVQAATSLLGHTVQVRNDNEADALWLLAMAADWAGRPLVHLPPRQHDVLTRCAAPRRYPGSPTEDQHG